MHNRAEQTNVSLTGFSDDQELVGWDMTVCVCLHVGMYVCMFVSVCDSIHKQTIVRGEQTDARQRIKKSERKHWLQVWP